MTLLVRRELRLLQARESLDEGHLPTERTRERDEERGVDENGQGEHEAWVVGDYAEEQQRHDG